MNRKGRWRRSPDRSPVRLEEAFYAIAQGEIAAGEPRHAVWELALRLARGVEGGPNLRIVGEYRGRSPARVVNCGPGARDSALPRRLRPPERSGSGESARGRADPGADPAVAVQAPPGGRARSIRVVHAATRGFSHSRHLGRLSPFFRRGRRGEPSTAFL